MIVQIDITDRKRAEQDTQIAPETAAHAARLNAVGVLATLLVHELAQPLNAASFFGRATLEQVLGNLICNGVQTIDEANASARQVTIETCSNEPKVTPGEQTDAGSPMVQITVSDTGPGLDVENEQALFDLFASRRSSGLGMRLPIIFLSGFGDVPNRVRADQSGAVDFLEKPVSKSKLTERIERAFEIDRRRRDDAGAV